MKIFKKLTALAMAAVTAGALGLSAFAGGPMPQEDEPAAESEASAAATRTALPSGLTVGGVYMLRPMSSSGVYVYAITVGDDEKTITLKDRSALKIEQAFQLIASANGYKLKALCSPTGKVLDVYCNTQYHPEENCIVDLWENKTSENVAQEFEITDGTSTSCVIRLANSNYNNLVLARVGTSVRLEEYDAAADNQRWRFVERTNTYTKDPDPDAQNKTNWCWAASAKMVAAHNGGGLNSAINTSPQTLTSNDGIYKPYYGYSISGTESRYLADGAQRAIVIQIKGNDKNNTGSDTDKENAIKFVSPDLTAYSEGNAEQTLSDNLIAKINSELEDERYVIGNLNGSSVHSIVIESHSQTNGTYTVFDPWNKKTYSVSHNDLFIDGFYPYNDKYHGRVEWFQYTVQGGKTL